MLSTTLKILRHLGVSIASTVVALIVALLEVLVSLLFFMPKTYEIFTVAYRRSREDLNLNIFGSVCFGLLACLTLPLIDFMMLILPRQSQVFRWPSIFTLLIDSFTHGATHGNFIDTLGHVIAPHFDWFMRFEMRFDSEFHRGIQAPDDAILLKTLDEIITPIPKNVAKINLLTKTEQQQMSAIDALENAKQRYDEIFTCPISQEIPKSGQMIMLSKQVCDHEKHWVDIPGCRWFYDKHSLAEWFKTKPINPVNRDKIEETNNTRYVVYKIQDVIPTTKSGSDLVSDELNLLIKDIRKTINNSVSDTRKFFDRSVKDSDATNDESNIPRQDLNVFQPK